MRWNSATVTTTVVAPSACTAAIAATYCALLLLITPIRLPASAVVVSPVM